MRDWRLLLAALASAWVLVPARQALGASPQRSLTELIEVHPGASCIDVATLASEVSTWLGADMADADLWIRVDGSPDDPRTVSFEVGREDRVMARRRFAPGPEQCANLEAVLGLTIALALRASLIDEIVGPAPAEAPPPAPVPAPDLWSAGAGGVVAFGVLPGTSLGAAVFAERSLPPSFALRLGLLGIASWNDTFPSPPGAFDAEIFAARLDACVRFDLSSRIVARGCAGVLAGAVLSQGRDFPSSRSASSGWAAAANAVAMRVGISRRWSLEGEVSLVLPFKTMQVGVLSPTGDVAEARDLSSVGVTMSLGPVFRF